jgi:hypothetical protein
MLPRRIQVRSVSRFILMALLSAAILTSGGCSWFFWRSTPDLGIDLAGTDRTHHVDTKTFAARVSNGLDSTTQSSAVTTDAGPSSTAYRGVQIWNLVREYDLAGPPDHHGNWLDDFALATGSDGYQVLFSAGELDPSFGNTHELIAVQTAGADPHHGPSPFLTTAPLDRRPARYVSSLVRLDVRKARFDAPSIAPGALLVDGMVEHPMTLHAADLARMPQTSVKIGDLTYSGASLWEVLEYAGIKADASRKGALLTMYAVASGQDGYHVVLSLAETSPEIGARRMLIAYPKDAGPSSAPRLVVADDIKHGRWVAQLCHISVADAALPHPAIP